MKITLFSLAIASAFAVALLTRPSPPQPAASPSAAAASVTDPAAILAAMPPASPATESGRLRAAAQAKAAAAPDDSKAWSLLGDALAQEFRDTANESLYDHAEAAFRRALALNSRSMEALTGLAWVFGGRHEFADSIAWAEKALAFDPKAAAALGIIGDAHLELGQYDDAAERYQQMMDARPDLSSWSRGAHLLWITGDKGKALWLMEKAIHAGAPFAENTAWCRARLAMMLFHDGALLPAEQALAPALQAGSRNPHVLLAAGRIAAARGNLDGAAAHFSTILEAGPHHDALAALGDIHAAKGDAVEAEKCYAAVEKLHASHSAKGNHTHLAMAKFLADHDRNLIEALRLAEQAKLTNNVQEADTIAWVYFKNNDLPRAKEAMKRALKFNTPDAAMRYHAGMIAAAAGDRAAAQRRLNEALSMNPSFDLLQAPVALKTLNALAPAAETAAARTPAQ